MYGKIKLLCEKNNVSITTVEKEAGLSNGAISKWKTSIPTVDKLKKVADYFGVSIEYFVNGNTDVVPKEGQ